jgi:zinc transport system ATP-binding protein
MLDKVVNLENVWVHHNEKVILEAVDLVVESNTFLGIIGPNGGGKTTILKVILGLIKPSKGKVEVLGKPPGHMGGHIGYVSQQNIFDSKFPINVEDVVLMGCLTNRKIGHGFNNADYQKTHFALEKVGMINFKKHQIGFLSGGEQQRVFIARAIVNRPKLLLLDEPTSSVDPHVQLDFYKLLDELKSDMALIMVSHDISAISIHVDDVACLNHRLFFHGSTEEVTLDELSKTYACPIQLLSHGEIPHRVLGEHEN